MKKKPQRSTALEKRLVRLKNSLFRNKQKLLIRKNQI